MGGEGSTEYTDVVLIQVLMTSDSLPRETSGTLEIHQAAKSIASFNLVHSKYFN